MKCFNCGTTRELLETSKGIYCPKCTTEVFMPNALTYSADKVAKPDKITEQQWKRASKKSIERILNGNYKVVLR